MYKSGAKYFPELRQYLDGVPVIETHEHYASFKKIEVSAVDYLIGNCFWCDYLTVKDSVPPPTGNTHKDRAEWFIRLFKRTDKTAFAKCVKTALRECWGVGSIDCYEDFLALEEKLLAADASMLDYHMERLNVKAMVSDIYDFNEFAGYLEGVTPHSKYARFSLNTGFFNDLHRYEDLFLLQKYLKKKITCLDDYLECFDNFLKRCVDFGIVALKVIAAYRRSLDFANPPKSEAESVFNEMTRNPRIIFGDEVVRPLDEWLFHYLMRKAAEYNLPVQVHAGYLAADNPRNIITDANAVNLTKTVELHKDVSFSLFHGNWPYMGEFLYMGKNYPNVHLDLCFTQNMDPPYCVELMKRAVMTVPHYKLHAFGGDMGRVDFVTAYLGLARDNVACALSELVESGWLDLGEAKQIAADWFFNNPNEFYSLGFDRITV